MRVGVFAKDTSDDGLRFLKQIGVDDVDLRLEYLDEYRTSGSLTAASARRVVERYAGFGLRINVANTAIEHLWDAYYGRPGADQQIDRLCELIRNIGEAGIPLVGIKPNNAQYLPPAGPPGHTVGRGRGGYGRPGINFTDADRVMDAPLGAVEPERIWDGYRRIYEAALPVAEEARVRLCQHGNDPPIPVYRGIPHVLNSFAAFDRLFDEFPSPNNGMTYCVGTRYESGEDVLAGIAHFGSERIFNVHFRNVIGPIPARGEYLETFLDDGDMDMGAVVAALEAAGYDGVLNIDHIPILDIEQEWDKKLATTWAVAYAQALVTAADPKRRAGGQDATA